MTFHDWLISRGKSDRTAKSYSSAIKGVISGWAVESDISKLRLCDIHAYSEIKDISRQLEAVDIYQQRNADGNGMYRAALNKYVEY